MKWLYKLERKYSNFCISNLMLVLIVGQAMVFLASGFTNINLYSKLSLFWPAVMQGEVWRLFTFLFVPASTSIISLLFYLYLYYVIGHTLENQWGDFKFNVYYFIGVIGIIVSSVIVGIGFNQYLNLSLFFAFATLYPDFEILLFFILPIKMKYLAFAGGFYYLLMFIISPIPNKISIAFSLVNYFIFFGGSFLRTARQELKYAKARRQWNNRNHSN